MTRPPVAAPTSVGAAVRAVARLSRVVERAAADHSLSVAQFRVLDRLHDGSALGGVLAEWLAVTPPSVTALVDALVKRGLVERRDDPDDRRRVEHSLTDAGRRLHDAVAEQLGRQLTELADRLDDRAASTKLVESLDGWNDALDLARADRLAARTAAARR